MWNRYVFLFIFLFISLLLAVVTPARANCTNPNGVAGQQMFNTTYKTMQFCDGTLWWNMKGGGGGTVPAGTEGSIQFYSGGALAYSSGLVFTSAGNVGIGTASPDEVLTVSGGIKFTSGVLTFPDATTMSTAPSGGGAITATADQGATCTTVGELAILTDNTSILACVDDGGGNLVWTNLMSGGINYTGPLVNAVHTGIDCTDTVFGVVVDDGSDNKFCKIDGISTCPAGWTQYQNWSITAATTCNYNSTRCPSYPSSCTTGSHAIFSNLAPEACSYIGISGTTSPDNVQCTITRTCLANYQSLGCY